MKMRYVVDTTPEENEAVRNRAHALVNKWGTPQSFIARQTKINQVYFNHWFNRHIAFSTEYLKRIQDFLDS